MNESRKYGVSYGNGNDGVSHLYPHFFVTTNDPYFLARVATFAAFKGEVAEWVRSEIQVDGEAEYTISATLYEDEDGIGAYGGGAYFICEVFPAEAASDRSEAPEYDSLDEAFRPFELLAAAKGDFIGFDIVSNDFWQHVGTGQTASVHGAMPAGQGWERRSQGFTVRWQDGSYGIPGNFMPIAERTFDAVLNRAETAASAGFKGFIVY